MGRRTERKKRLKELTHKWAKIALQGLKEGLQLEGLRSLFNAFCVKEGINKAQDQPTQIEILTLAEEELRKKGWW